MQATAQCDNAVGREAVPAAVRACGTAYLEHHVESVVVRAKSSSEINPRRVQVSAWFDTCKNV
jgi:hypothetical protein